MHVFRSPPDGLSSCLQVQSAQSISITKPVADEVCRYARDSPQSEEPKTHSFTFDRVLDEATPQSALYEACVKVHARCCGLTYSPWCSPSSKATMDPLSRTGRPARARRTRSRVRRAMTRLTAGLEGEQRGIIPRTSEDIFGYIENTSDAHSKFLVRASFLQV